VNFQMQPRACARVAREGGKLCLVALLLSLVSFGFVAVYLGAVLRMPSASLEPPEGYSSWHSCHANAKRPAVTALGRKLPYNKARALVSVPKVFEVALITAVLGRLLAQRRTVAFWVNALTLGGIALLAAPLYIFAGELGIRALPSFVDPLVTFSMLVVLAATFSVSVVRQRNASTGLVTSCPKFLFFVGMALIFSFNTVLVNFLAAAERRGLSPMLVVCTSVVLFRGSSFVARLIFRGLSLPLVFCFAIFFAYDVSMVLALRRYSLALPSLGEVALSALLSVLLELACNGASAAFAVWSYNAFLARRCEELASVQINIFFTAIVSELLAEHVALHGCLGYNLFLDHRVLTLGVQRDRYQAVMAWAISFAMEVVTDVATLVPMILFLPVSFGAVLSKHRQLLPAALFILCVCVHPHLVGMHTYLDRTHYMCD